MTLDPAQSSRPAPLDRAAVARLASLDAVSAPFTRVNLREALARYDTDVFEVARRASRAMLGMPMGTEELTLSVDDVRGALVDGIGKVWSNVRRVDNPSMEYEVIVQPIRRGAHPLDVILDYMVILYAIGAEQWANAERGMSLKYVNLVTNAEKMGEAGDIFPADTLIRGGETGTLILLAIIDALPNRWRLQFDGEMPPGELDASVNYKAVSPLLSVWKKMKGGPLVTTFEHDIFDGVARSVMTPMGNERLVWNPEKVELFRTASGAWMGIPTADVVMRLAAGDYPLEPYPSRGYCPAASAFDADKVQAQGGEVKGLQSVLVEHAERVIELARRHWLPWYRARYSG